MYTLDAKDKIIKAKVLMQRDMPFYSYILMSMNIEQSQSTNEKSCPTMAVNRYGDLFWNEKFVNKLSMDEIKFVLAHEASHVSTLTFQRQGLREHTLWNIATDLAINDMLVQDGMKAPKDILLADSSGNWTFTGKNNKKVTIPVRGRIAEEIYDDIEKNANTVKVYVNADGQGGYDGSIDKHLDGGKDPEGNKKHDESEAGGIANGNKWKKTAAEAATHAKARGKGSAIMERELDALLNPKIDWRKRLYQFITKDLPVNFTMARPGRRTFANGYYCPSIIKENLEIVVGVDTSGSISEKEFTEFMNEVIGIANGFSQIKMRVIAWADSVLEEDDIEVTRGNMERLLKYKPKNTGGTTMKEFTKYVMQKNYRSPITIILTDGFIEEKPGVPPGKIMFVLSSNGDDKIIKNYGEVCKLSDRKAQ